MVTAYQLYYNNKTRAKIDPLAIPVDTTGVVTPYFESYWMMHLPIPESGWMGVFSPEFHRKARITLSRFIMKTKLSQADVSFPLTLAPGHNTWMQGAMAHPMFWKKASLVLRNANLEWIMHNNTANIFSNYFLMRVELWHEFRADWLGPVMASLDKYADHVDIPCSYASSSQHNTAQIEKATGFPFYTYRPFICERLIGSFVHHKKLNLYQCH